MLEHNVTRAAINLGMSQPAVSNSLRRARTVLQDELFMKVAHGVRPTPRMESIWPDLQESLGKLRAIASPRSFDPSSDSTNFRVSVTDSLASGAVHATSLRLLAEAPHARVTFIAHTNIGSLDGIERGSLDCAIGMFPALPRGLHVSGLRTDEYVCLMRHDNPLAETMTLEQFVAAPHVLVTPSGQEMGVVDKWLSLKGLSRNIRIIVNHFRDAFRILSDSGELLACVPLGFAETMLRDRQGTERLAIMPLPFETEKLIYKLVWHDRVHANLSHTWFRSLIADSCQGALSPDRWTATCSSDGIRQARQRSA